MSQHETEQYGAYKLKKINSSTKFWALMDELVNDNSGFYCNRCHILDAYTNGWLYTVYMTETEWMFYNLPRDNPIFCKGTLWMFPCFCVFNEHRGLDIIWTHTRMCGNGLATFMVRELNITKVKHLLEPSLGFWSKIGFVKKTDNEWVLSDKEQLDASLDKEE